MWASKRDDSQSCLGVNDFPYLAGHADEEIGKLVKHLISYMNSRLLCLT